jgi:hypothetical protein
MKLPIIPFCGNSLCSERPLGYCYANPGNQANDVHGASEALHLRPCQIVVIGALILPPNDHGIGREWDTETTINQ